MVPPSEDKSYIEELKKSLYSPNAPLIRTRRKLRYDESKSNIRQDWEDNKEPTEEPVLNTKYESHHMSFFTKLLIASFIFCVLAVGLGAYLFLNGTNLISANNIDVKILAPVSVAGGDEVPFDIKVTNNNNVSLELADLKVDFPAGTTDPNDPSKELRSFTELIGDLVPGASATKSVKAIMFGEENVKKTVLVTITYKVKGSTSLFKKEATYDLLINSSPINVTIDSFKEITSAQEFDMTIKLKSNSKEILKSILLKGTYPFGYTYLSSSIKPIGGNNTWTIGDIPPGGERSITIHGRLSGEDSDSRTFNFTVGAKSSRDPQSIGTLYTALSQSMTIQKPFISMKISVNGENSTGDHIGQFDHPERVEIQWFNNLSSTVSNVEITAKLSGSAYDRGGVMPDFGYYRSATDEIIWNQQTNKDLANVAGGADGVVSFSLAPKDLSTNGHPVVNPMITILASVAGDRTQEINVPVALKAAVSKNIKISSNIALTGRVVRSGGPFPNTGPIPPKVNQPSTYTVIWTVDNTSSTVQNAQVTATLPAYIKWLGMTSPASESVSYNTNTGTITWNIGDIGTYTYGSQRRREVSFQVSYEPSQSQLGQTPTIVNQSNLTAVDSYTGENLQSSQDYLTTRFATDPTYKQGDETVVQ